MKKALIALLSVLLMFQLIACKGSGDWKTVWPAGPDDNTTTEPANDVVPDALLDLVIQDWIKEFRYDDCLKQEITTTHKTDQAAHLDTVTIHFVFYYQYGRYELDLTELLYQYDRTSDLWSILQDKKGVMSEPLMVIDENPDYLGTYEGVAKDGTKRKLVIKELDLVNNKVSLIASEITPKGKEYYADDVYDLTVQSRPSPKSDGFRLRYNYRKVLRYSLEHPLFATIYVCMYLCPEEGFVFRADYDFPPLPPVSDVYHK